MVLTMEITIFTIQKTIVGILKFFPVYVQLYSVDKSQIILVVGEKIDFVQYTALEHLALALNIFFQITKFCGSECGI